MSAQELVRALAIAWSTKQLYPNPEEVEAFQDAVRRIGENADPSNVLAVTLDGFEHEGEPVAAQQASATRLAQALFASEVGTIAFVKKPSVDEVLTFLTAVEDSQDAGDEEYSLIRQVQAADVKSILVVVKELFDGSVESKPEVMDEDPDAESIMEVLTDSQDGARRVVDEAGDLSASPPEEAAAELDRRYTEAWDAVADDEDWLGREDAVQTYVEVFMKLPPGSQNAFLRLALRRKDQRPYGNFIDQFAGSELAQLAMQLDEGSMDMLLDYVKAVSDQESDRTELLPLMAEGADLDSAREGVAGVVGKRLEAVAGRDQSAETVAAARAEVEAARSDLVGVEVATTLFDIELRDVRRARLSRVWASKINEALAAGDFDRGLAWLTALGDVPSLDRSDARAFLGAIANDQILTEVAGGDHPHRAQLVEWLSQHAGDQLVEMMAEEEDASRRRLLIDVVAEVAKTNPTAVFASLQDDRWYVVRNVVLALGKSKQPDAIEPLGALLSHHDHRVRLEVLRALVACGGVLSVPFLGRALRDDHVRVRSSAMDLLGVLEAPEARRALISAAKDEEIPPEERVDLIEVIGKLGTPDARQALQTLARGRGLFGPGRTLKKAAKQALGTGK